MRVAHGRRRALLDALLDAAARHAALRALQAGELAWLRRLQAAAEGARGVLEAAAAAATAREAAYEAAAGAHAARQRRSTVAPDDALLARLQQALTPSAADWAAVHTGQPAAGHPPHQQQHQQQQRGTPGAAPLTPRGRADPAAATPGAAGAAPFKDIAARLSALAGALRGGEARLEAGLFEELPARARGAAGAERALERLVFPRGLDAAVAAAAAAAASSHEGAGEGGVDGAAAPEPVLTSPELAAAMRGLEALNHQVGAAINALLQQQQDWAALQKERPRELGLERRVMALMFSDPQALRGEVDALRGRVAALEAGEGGGGVAGDGGGVDGGGGGDF